ncbi:hypothetical protein BH24DEI2_BH24DEI2_00230 [soil metagenome]
MADAHEYGYTVIFEKEGDAYTATVPALDYSSTYGETLEEARKMVKSLIQLYLESLKADGLGLPEPDIAEETFTERISVALV